MNNEHIRLSRKGGKVSYEVHEPYQQIPVILFFQQFNKDRLLTYLCLVVLSEVNASVPRPFL